MGTLALLVCLVLPALAVCFDYIGNARAGWPFPNPMFHEVWPGVLMPHGHFFPGNLFQTPGFPEPWPGFPMPLQTLNVGPSFIIKLMNPSWSGPAGSNVYPRGALVPLQVFSSLPPDQELYIQSCYATPSPDMADDYRLSLIHNKGCVSSKQPVIRFISRNKDSINLLMDTSILEFSQLYLHCRVLASMSALTPDTKSCNYDHSKASWVELGGSPGVCDCCASKCSGPPHLGGPFSETKAIISTGPLSIKGFEHEEIRPSVLTHSSFTSSLASSPLEPTQFFTPRFGSAPWSGPPAVPLWFPGHGVVPPGPLPQLEVRLPRHVEDFQSPAGVPVDGVPGLSVLIPGASEFTGPDRGYVADKPTNQEQAQEEELRGDVFMNYKWEVKPGSTPLEEENEDAEVTWCDSDGEAIGRRSVLAFTSDPDGSSTIIYEREEKNPSLPDPEGKRTGARLALCAGTGEVESEKPSQEVKSLLDMLRGLNKMVTGLEPQ